jgi:DNA-binding response OmpR family regulator
MNTVQGYLLLVEDDRDISELLETALTFKGYRVMTASNGSEGLKAIQNEHPAIVITDIMMPKLDGFGLVQRLRINPETRTIPVVFISATYVAAEDREFSLSIGVTRFIQKPVDLEAFLVTIKELLEQETPVEVKPFNEFEFYNGYHERLEAKLQQKVTQIARDELLLQTISSEGEKASLQTSLYLAINEREEIKQLLEQIQGQLKKLH